MSEVKRYEMFECAENRYVPARKVIGAEDFDRVTAERDAERRRADVAVADANDAEAVGKKVSELLAKMTAERDALQQDLNQRDEQIATLDLQREAHLRNSQVVERRVDELQQRLTAADEREGALGSLVPEAELALKALNVAVSVYDVELADSARRGLRLIIAALKPAEGGGDE